VYFPLSLYQEICDEIKRSNISVYTVEQYIIEKPSKQFIILRHDVDLNPSRAVNMARIEYLHRIKATYYFRFMPFIFDLNKIKLISKMGHEIGYHYETLKKNRGNIEEAIALFKTELKKFRQSGINVKTVCAHGSKGTVINFDIFHHYPQLREEENLIGEAYLDIDFSDLTYVSDSMGVWTKHKHGVNQSRRNQRQEQETDKAFASEPKNIVKLIRDVFNSKTDRYYFLVHPQYYIKNYNKIVKITNFLIQSHIIPHILVMDQLR